MYYEYKNRYKSCRRCSGLTAVVHPRTKIRARGRPGAPDPGQTDSDGDQAGNACDPDDNGDGLDDVEEGLLGTNPLLADTDGDGFSDSAEVDAGTDPNSNASFPGSAPAVPIAIALPLLAVATWVGARWAGRRTE